MKKKFKHARVQRSNSNLSFTNFLCFGQIDKDSKSLKLISVIRALLEPNTNP